MTETQLIHDMARVHWWSRNSDGLIAVDASLVEGDVVPEIEAKWAAAKESEVAAMQSALHSVTLLSVLS